MYAGFCKHGKVVTGTVGPKIYPKDNPPNDLVFLYQNILIFPNLFYKCLINN